MAYAFIESRLMPKQAVASIISTTAAVPVGTIVRAKDPTFGEGEFIYLPTTASVTLSNIVSYRMSASGVYTVARTPTSGAIGSPLAVAMVTGLASCFGWFQISGTGPVLKTAVIVSTGKPMFLSGTAGRLKQISSTTKGCVGLWSSNTAAVASATSTVTCSFNRPAAIPI